MTVLSIGMMHCSHTHPNLWLETPASTDRVKLSIHSCGSTKTTSFQGEISVSPFSKCMFCLAKALVNAVTIRLWTLVSGGKHSLLSVSSSSSDSDLYVQMLSRMLSDSCVGLTLELLPELDSFSHFWWSCLCSDFASSNACPLGSGATLSNKFCESLIMNSYRFRNKENTLAKFNPLAKKHTQPNASQTLLKNWDSSLMKWHTTPFSLIIV